VTPHAIAVYCQSHPIGFALALFILSIPFSVYSSEIKAFIRLPPQRRSQWVLKARIAATEKKISQIIRSRDDFRYAIRLIVFHTLQVLLIMLFLMLAILAVVFNIFDPSQSGRYFVKGLVWCSVFGCYYAPYVVNKIIIVMNAMVDNGKSLKRLEEHFANLRLRSDFE
jgi:hypothetical protein